MGSDSDDSSTEERIDRLESVVKQQNETIREMLPGRRAVLAGAGAAALGFAGGSGSASGQSAVGQVGTESEPVDVEAADVAAQAVNTVKSVTEKSKASGQYNLVYDNDPDQPAEERFRILDWEGSVVAEDFNGQMITRLQNLFDNQNPRTLEITSVDGNLVWADQLDVNNRAHIYGHGRNNGGNLGLSGDNGTGIFRLSGGEAIYELSDMKLTGTTTTQSTGTGIKVDDAFEVLLNGIEIRSFPDHGLHIQNDSPDQRWCYASDSWFLDSDGVDVYFDEGTEPVVDWTFDNCKFDAQGTARSVLFGNGFVGRNISFTGCRFSGIDPVRFAGETDVHNVIFDGCTFVDVRGSSIIDFKDRVSGTHEGRVIIDDCTFEASSTNQPSHAIRVRDGWEGIVIGDNTYNGFGSWPVRVGDNNESRLRNSQNGAYFVSSGQTVNGADYDRGDAGKMIVDRNDTEPLRTWIVMPDGSIKEIQSVT